MYSKNDGIQIRNQIKLECMTKPTESLNGQFTPLTLSNCVRRGLPTLSLTVGAVWKAGF